MRLFAMFKMLRGVCALIFQNRSFGGLLFLRRPNNNFRIILYRTKVTDKLNIFFDQECNAVDRFGHPAYKLVGTFFEWPFPGEDAMKSDTCIYCYQKLPPDGYKQLYVQEIKSDPKEK